MTSEDYSDWADKIKSIESNDHYINIIKQAELFCQQKEMPQTFLNKIKKFKKEIENE